MPLKHNTRHITWDSGDISCPPQHCFLRVGIMEAKKFNTWRKEAQLFVGIWVRHGVSQLNLTQVVAGFHLQKSYFMK